MSPRLRRAERTAQTRAALLAAARRVFAQRGYAGASVTDIAEEAGYSHGAVYSNFAGKQDLFLALFDEHTDQRVAAITEDIAQAGGSPAQRARAAADGMMRRAREDPDSFVLHLEFAIVAARDPELRDRFAERLSRARVLITELLTEQEAAGTLHDHLPPGDSALVIDALATGLQLAATLDPSSVRVELFGDVIEHLIASMEP